MQAIQSYVACHAAFKALAPPYSLWKFHATCIAVYSAEHGAYAWAFPPTVGIASTIDDDGAPTSPARAMAHEAERYLDLRAIASPNLAVNLNKHLVMSFSSVSM